MGGRGAKSINAWGEKGTVSKKIQRKYGNKFEIKGSPMAGVYTVLNSKKNGLIAEKFDANHKGGPRNYLSLADVERFTKDFQSRGVKVTVNRLR